VTFRICINLLKQIDNLSKNIKKMKNKASKEIEESEAMMLNREIFNENQIMIPKIDLSYQQLNWDRYAEFVGILRQLFENGEWQELQNKYMK